MAPLKVVVKNGRIVVDAPTDLPDGTELELVSIDDPVAAALSSAAVDDHGPTDVERNAIEEFRSGRAKLVPHEDVRAKNAARR